MGSGYRSSHDNDVAETPPISRVNPLNHHTDNAMDLELS